MSELQESRAQPEQQEQTETQEPKVFKAFRVTPEAKAFKA